jgi:hypothetical protein
MIALCRSCRRLRSFDLDLDLPRLHGRQKIAAFGSSYGVVRSFDLAFDLQHIHGRQKIAAFGSSYGVVRSFGGVAFGELSSPARQEFP